MFLCKRLLIPFLGLFMNLLCFYVYRWNVFEDIFWVYLWPCHISIYTVLHIFKSNNRPPLCVCVCVCVCAFVCVSKGVNWNFQGLKHLVETWQVTGTLKKWKKHCPQALPHLIEIHNIISAAPELAVGLSCSNYCLSFSLTRAKRVVGWNLGCVRHLFSSNFGHCAWQDGRSKGKGFPFRPFRQGEAEWSCKGTISRGLAKRPPLHEL